MISWQQIKLWTAELLICVISAFAATDLLADTSDLDSFLRDVQENPGTGLPGCVRGRRGKALLWSLLEMVCS